MIIYECGEDVLKDFDRVVARMLEDYVEDDKVPCSETFEDRRDDESS